MFALTLNGFSAKNNPDAKAATGLVLLLFRGVRGQLLVVSRLTSDNRFMLPQAIV